MYNTALPLTFVPGVTVRSVDQRSALPVVYLDPCLLSVVLLVVITTILARTMKFRYLKFVRLTFGSLATF